MRCLSGSSFENVARVRPGVLVQRCWAGYRLFCSQCFKTRYERLRQASHRLKRPVSNPIAMVIALENNVIVMDIPARKFFIELLLEEPGITLFKVLVTEGTSSQRIRFDLA